MIAQSQAIATVLTITQHHYTASLMGNVYATYSLSESASLVGMAHTTRQRMITWFTNLSSANALLIAHVIEKAFSELYS